MVTWREIKEYQIISGENSSISKWSFPNRKESDILVGKLHTILGDLEIYEQKEGNQFIYYIFHNKEIISFLGLEKRGSANYYNARNVLTKNEYKGKGLSSGLLYWVLENYSYKVLNDTQMTKEGEAVWLSVAKKKRMYVVNIKTGDQELWTGNNSMDPRKDDKSEKEISQDPINGQKIFWLFEGYLEPLLENINKFGIPNHSKEYRSGLGNLLQRYNPDFGLGEP
jgi:hypothetical protein